MNQKFVSSLAVCIFLNAVALGDGHLENAAGPQPIFAEEPFAVASTPDETNSQHTCKVSVRYVDDGWFGSVAEGSGACNRTLGRCADWLQANEGVSDVVVGPIIGISCSKTGKITFSATSEAEVKLSTSGLSQSECGYGRRVILGWGCKD